MAKRDSNLVSIDLLKEKRILREGVPHSFEKTTFSSLTYCNLCRDFMWGLTNEGVECTRKIIFEFDFPTDFPIHNHDEFLQNVAFQLTAHALKGFLH
jgi:hypothetical protein